MHGNGISPAAKDMLSKMTQQVTGKERFLQGGIGDYFGINGTVDMRAGHLQFACK